MLYAYWRRKTFLFSKTTDSEGKQKMARFGFMRGVASLALALGCGAAMGCNFDGSEPTDGSLDGSEFVDVDGEATDAESIELGTSQQALWFYSPFAFNTSCSDTKGINSVMAAIAVSAATELKRWQPSKDFVSSGGMLKLTTTGKVQCSDGKCWNTQALLDLQNAPTGTVQIRPGVTLDTRALKSALSTNLMMQLMSMAGFGVPEHKFELMHSQAGGCDQYYWFNVTAPSGKTLLSSVISKLQDNLTWVGGRSNPYIQFQTDGTMVGIDPTYGLNEAGSTTSGSCVAACTKVSSTDVTGSCCSCDGTKKFKRSAWNVSTYLCQ